MALGMTPTDFGRDPSAFFIGILEAAPEAVDAKHVLGRAEESGIPIAAARAKWKAFQEVLRFHPRIDRPTSRTYRWRAEPVAPGEALDRLVALLDTTDRVKAPLRDALVTAIRADEDARVRAARERQFRLDALHAVAELAAEVEELAYDSGDADLIVERLRARVRAGALEQVGRPGDEVTFDPARHEAQGPRPADGAAVTVVRPGYAVAENGSPLVLRKALVVAE